MNGADPSGMGLLVNVMISTAIIGILATLGGKAGFAITGTLKGRVWGAIAGGALGLAIALSLFAGGGWLALKAPAYGLLNVMFTYFGLALVQEFPNPPPRLSDQARREKLIQAFAGGVLGAIGGSFVNPEYAVKASAISGAINSLVSNYEQGQSLTRMLYNAILGAALAAGTAHVFHAHMPGTESSYKLVQKTAEAIATLGSDIAFVAPQLFSASILEWMRQDAPRAYRFFSSPIEELINEGLAP